MRRSPLCRRSGLSPRSGGEGESLGDVAVLRLGHLGDETSRHAVGHTADRAGIRSAPGPSTDRIPPRWPG
jgi:hypothetical protein